MCYFIHVKVTPQRKPAEAQLILEQAANHQGLYLNNIFTHTQVTNGHCSCKYVKGNGREDGKAITVTAFLEEIVKSIEVKSLEVGWAWSKAMAPDAIVEKLSSQDFLARNEVKSLNPDTWYKTNDPSKYNFQQ